MEHEISIYVRVFDREALYAAARAKMEEDKIEGEDADEVLKPGGEIDSARCLQMLLDPGESPPGCEILDSTCESRGDDSDDDSDEPAGSMECPENLEPCINSQCEANGRCRKLPKPAEPEQPREIKPGERVETLDAPHRVSSETAYGRTVSYPFSIKVF